MSFEPPAWHFPWIHKGLASEPRPAASLSSVQTRESRLNLHESKGMNSKASKRMPTQKIGLSGHALGNHNS